MRQAPLNKPAIRVRDGDEYSMNPRARHAVPAQGRPCRQVALRSVPATAQHMEASK